MNENRSTDKAAIMLTHGFLVTYLPPQISKKKRSQINFLLDHRPPPNKHLGLTFPQPTFVWGWVRR